jgi:GAF domain-containing protein
MDGTLAEQLADAARELRGEDDPRETMAMGVKLAVAQVDGADDASVSLVDARGRIETPALSSERVRRVDELQLELDEGPCLEAIRQHETVHSPDLAADDRWPGWGRRVVDETGVRSMLCFQLYTHEDNVGALNLYSSSVDGFDQDDRHHGLALAAHLAVAVAAAQEIEQLRTAVDTRTVIGEALGILMERFDLSSERAFAVLTRVASQQNRKVRAVATELVETRVLAGLPPGTRPD